MLANATVHDTLEKKEPAAEAPAPAAPAAAEPAPAAPAAAEPAPAAEPAAAVPEAQGKMALELEENKPRHEQERTLNSRTYIFFPLRSRCQEDYLRDRDDPPRRERVEQPEPILRLVRRGSLGEGGGGGGGGGEGAQGHGVLLRPGMDCRFWQF